MLDRRTVLKSAGVAAAGLSEPLFMLVMIVKKYNLLPVAAGTGIVPHVSRIKRINGSKNRWINSCPPIISS